MAEPVDLDSRDLDHGAVVAELEELTATTQAKIRRLADEFHQVVSGLDTLYLRVLLEQLVGQWELPRARLRFQRDLDEGLDHVIAQCVSGVLKGEDLTQTPLEIVETMNRERRRHPPNGKS